MKKNYSEPEMEVIGLSREDMILTSGCEDVEYCAETFGCMCDQGIGDAVCSCHGASGEEDSFQ